MFIIHQLIACELFQQKTIVRLVGIQGANHVVAVTPGHGTDLIGRELSSFRIGIAGEVEPVAAPALTIAGRGEEAINHLVVGVGLRVGEEGLGLSGRRRQASQIKVSTTDQRELAGFS